jgi:hypothetical protein
VHRTERARDGRGLGEVEESIMPWSDSPWTEATESESDKRQALRYPLELPVELPGGSGRSHDVSRSGVSFETDTPVSLESPIKFSLVLGQTSPDVPLRLDCEGEVVRVEPHDGGVSVAVKLTSCQ